MSPADRVREALQAEESRLRRLGYDRQPGSFWRSFESYRDGLLGVLVDVYSYIAVREACYDAVFGWSSSISFGGYAEGLSADLAEAAFPAG